MQTVYYGKELLI